MGSLKSFFFKKTFKGARHGHSFTASQAKLTVLYFKTLVVRASLPVQMYLIKMKYGAIKSFKKS